MIRRSLCGGGVVGRVAYRRLTAAFLSASSSEATAVKEQKQLEKERSMDELVAELSTQHERAKKVAMDALVDSIVEDYSMGTRKRTHKHQKQQQQQDWSADVAQLFATDANAYALPGDAMVEKGQAIAEELRQTKHKLSVAEISTALKRASHIDAVVVRAALYGHLDAAKLRESALTADHLAAIMRYPLELGQELMHSALKPARSLIKQALVVDGLVPLWAVHDQMKTASSDVVKELYAKTLELTKATRLTPLGVVRFLSVIRSHTLPADDPLFKLLGGALDRPDTLHPQEVVQLAKAINDLKLRDFRFIKKIVSSMSSTAVFGSAVDLRAVVDLVIQLSRMKLGEDGQNDVWRQLLDHTWARVNELQPKQLSSIVCALAEVNVRSEKAQQLAGQVAHQIRTPSRFDRADIWLRTALALAHFDLLEPCHTERCASTSFLSELFGRLAPTAPASLRAYYAQRILLVCAASRDAGLLDTALQRLTKGGFADMKNIDALVLAKHRTTFGVNNLHGILSHIGPAKTHVAQPTALVEGAVLADAIVAPDYKDGRLKALADASDEEKRPILFFTDAHRLWRLNPTGDCRLTGPQAFGVRLLNESKSCGRPIIVQDLELTTLESTADKVEKLRKIIFSRDNASKEQERH